MSNLTIEGMNVLEDISDIEAEQINGGVCADYVALRTEFLVDVSTPGTDPAKLAASNAALFQCVFGVAGTFAQAQIDTVRQALADGKITVL